MNATEDYCELCDLPTSQCIHGRPPTPVAKAAKPVPAPRKRPTTKPRPAGTPPKRRTLRWTPPEFFEPLIITVLEDSGGELEADDLFVRLEELAGDRLRPEDSETTPEGELRWRYAARRARVALIAQGRMTKTTPGVWQLA